MLIIVLPADFCFQFIELFRIDAPFDDDISVGEAELDLCKTTQNCEMAIRTFVKCWNWARWTVARGNRSFMRICHWYDNAVFWKMRQMREMVPKQIGV